MAIRKSKTSTSTETPWNAYGPEKEAWKRRGNYFTATELQDMHKDNGISVRQMRDKVMSAD